MLLLEAALRLSGFGYPAGFYRSSIANAEKVFRDNPLFTWRFFPKSIARAQIPFAIPVAKTPDTYRIFVMGESAAQGIPDHTFSFARVLEVMLRDRYPAVRFEIVNTGITAINSHVIREIARDCARLSPDLFIIYMGNNEVVGPWGAGTVFAPLAAQALIRGRIALTRFRTGQLLADLVSARSGREPQAAWHGMEMFLANQIAATDPRMELDYQHFEQNLKDIYAIARGAGIPTMVSTVPVNLLDCGPFGSLHSKSLTGADQAKWESTYREGVALAANARHADAIDKFRKAVSLDSQFAELHYRLGRSYWTVGNYPEAVQHLAAARDADTLRFRADSRINAIIRTTAGQMSGSRVVLEDAESDFAAGSSHGVPGESLFCDHVHMTFAGNYLLASKLSARLTALLPEWVRQKVCPGVTDLSEAECARRLALSEWDQHRIAGQVLYGLLSRPPFTLQPNHEEQIGRRRHELDQTHSYADDDQLYQQALERSPSDWWLRYNDAVFRLNTKAETSDTETRFRSFIGQFDDYAPAHGNLGTALMRSGNYSAASDEFREEQRLNPSSASAHANLGLALTELGHLQEAITEYRRALEIDSEHAGAHNDLGTALAQQGKADEAIAEYRAATRINPNYDGAHYNLAAALMQQGQIPPAIDEFEAALRTRPQWPEAHNDLAIALYQQGRKGEALDHWREALRLKPDFAEVHNNLGRALAEQGRTAEAIGEFQAALKINPQYEAARNNLAIMLQGSSR